MTQHSPTALHGSSEVQKRPKGILKNSFQGSLPRAPVSPTHITSPLANATTAVSPSHPDLSDKELTLQNTLQNAGQRRSSSSAARSVSRRQSSTSVPGSSDHDPDGSMRLKWDEANLYLAEQEKSSTMKITEPKTPYAGRYDPDEDADEMRTLDAQDLLVDELDKAKATGGPGKTRARDEDIPGLDIGEPEEAVPAVEPDEDDRVERPRSASLGKVEKHVSVGEGEDEERPDHMSAEEWRKHREFEERRKKHYEMKDIRGLLGHPEEIDDEMDEDDDSPAPPLPAVPKVHGNLVNGGRP